MDKMENKMNNQENRKKSYFDMRILIGIAIMLGGTILLLQRLDIEIFPFDIKVWDYWPLLVIFVGLGKMIQPKESRHVFAGSVFVVIGTLFLLNNFRIIHFGFGDLWPLMIIVIGIVIIKRAFSRESSHCWSGREHNGRVTNGSHFHTRKRDFENDFIDVSVVLGSAEYNVTNKQLRGAKLDSILGSIELDLRDAEMVGDSILFDASVVMGSVELRIPLHWEVVMQGTPVMGSLDNKTNAIKEQTKKLVIKGSAVMGAVEVKN